MKKIHKFHNLLGLIYAVIMLIPFCSIFVRTLYVTLNHNAYESYSGNESVITDFNINYKYETNDVESVDDLAINKLYYLENFDLRAFLHTAPVNTSFRLSIVSCIIEDYSFDAPFLDDFYIDETLSNFFQIECYALDTVEGSTFFGTYLTYYVGNTGLTIGDIFSYLSLSDVNFYFSDIESIGIVNTYYLAPNGYLPSSSTYNEIVSVEPIYSEVSNLDNAFEYSLNKIVNSNNIGKLNLTNWFTDIFLDSTNSQNMLYLNFINWYMNYALMISCVYLLFLVLMWFITMARRLLTSFGERS